MMTISPKVNSDTAMRVKRSWESLGHHNQTLSNHISNSNSNSTSKPKEKRSCLVLSKSYPRCEICSGGRGSKNCKGNILNSIENGKGKDERTKGKKNEKKKELGSAVVKGVQSSSVQ